MRRVIQTFKAPDQWINGPPGLGDFVRGACHLFEMLQVSGLELRIDVSQTEFVNHIKQNPYIFQSGDPDQIKNAEEHFVDHLALHNRLVAFLNSDEPELYICTNLGSWNRLTLPETICTFAKNLYDFSEEIEWMVASELRVREYEVLSVRCGDSFYNDSEGRDISNLKSLICSIIERQILPRAYLPLVLTSDCYELKVELSKLYGMLTLPHRSQHGAFGNVLPVAMDLCMLKHSRFNYHINCWAGWWSGFSHYTSIIFNIPSMNFRAPKFAREEINAQGELFTVPL